MVARLQLHGTPLSHFTRKVRVLLVELAVEYDFVRLPGVLVAGTEAYGDNPLLRVPALVDEDVHLFESDHIARYIVGRFDPGDRFDVRSEQPDALNRLAIINGIMANEVTLLLAKRAGADVASIAYFGKLTTAIDNALAWLDARTEPAADTFDYRDIALVCLWQHLEHYAFVPGLDRYTRLAARVAHLAPRPSLAATTPAASLAEAAAAGWTPG